MGIGHLYQNNRTKRDPLWVGSMGNLRWQAYINLDNSRIEVKNPDGKTLYLGISCENISTCAKNGLEKCKKAFWTHSFSSSTRIYTKATQMVL